MKSVLAQFGKNNAITISGVTRAIHLPFFIYIKNDQGSTFINKRKLQFINIAEEVYEQQLTDEVRDKIINKFEAELQQKIDEERVIQLSYR